MKKKEEANLDARFHHLLNRTAPLSEIPQNITRSITRQLKSIGIAIPNITLPIRIRQTSARIGIRRKSVPVSTPARRTIRFASSELHLHFMIVLFDS